MSYPDNLLMNRPLKTNEKPPYEDSLKYPNGDKECPYCGQVQIPFKLGICICGGQVGKIKYVNTPKNFAKNYYSYLEETSC